VWNSTRTWAFVWIFFLLLLQNALHFVFPREIFPFLLVGVIFYGLSEGPRFGFVSGCTAGFLLDLLGVGRIGPQLLLYGWVGMVSGWSASTLFPDSLWTQLFLPVISNVFVLVLSRLIYQDFSWQEGGVVVVLGSAAEWRSLLLTLVVSPLLFRFLKFVSFASVRWR